MSGELPEVTDGVADAETPVAAALPSAEEDVVAAEAAGSAADDALAAEKAEGDPHDTGASEPAGTDADEGETVAPALPMADDPAAESLRPALEAILLVVDEPVAVNLLAQVLERSKADVEAALEALAADYTEQGRGFDLRRAAGGWRIYTREDYAGYVEKFVLEGQQARLTQAALETLAVIAYRQPVTRSRISAIRGVAVDGVIRTLLTRRLIEECGVEHETGGYLYRTTPLFLERLGLDRLEELPPLAPLLPEMDSLDDVIAAS